MSTSCPTNPSLAPPWLRAASCRTAQPAVWVLLAATAAQAEIRESRACPTSENTASFCFANDPRPADGCAS